jgi:hypothetical protein
MSAAASPIGGRPGAAVPLVPEQHERAPKAWDLDDPLQRSAFELPDRERWIVDRTSLV